MSFTVQIHENTAHWQLNIFCLVTIFLITTKHHVKIRIKVHIACCFCLPFGTYLLLIDGKLPSKKSSSSAFLIAAVLQMLAIDAATEFLYGAFLHISRNMRASRNHNGNGTFGNYDVYIHHIPLYDFLFVLYGNL